MAHTKSAARWSCLTQPRVTLRQTSHKQDGFRESGQLYTTRLLFARSLCSRRSLVAFSFRRAVERAPRRWSKNVPKDVGLEFRCTTSRILKVVCIHCITTITEQRLIDCFLATYDRPCAIFPGSNLKLSEHWVQVTNLQRYNSKAHIRVNVFGFESDESQTGVFLCTLHEKAARWKRYLLSQCVGGYSV